MEWLAALHERDPDDRDIDRGLAKALILLGRMERRRGDEAAARNAWERARSFLAPAAQRSGSVKLLEPWATASCCCSARPRPYPFSRSFRLAVTCPATWWSCAGK